MRFPVLQTLHYAVLMIFGTVVTAHKTSLISQKLWSKSALISFRLFRLKRI